jgi:hypothetical protein
MASQGTGNSIDVHFPEAPSQGGLAGVRVVATFDEIQGRTEIVGLSIQPLTDNLHLGKRRGLDKHPKLVISAELLRSVPLGQLKEMFLEGRRGGDPFAPFHQPRRTGRAPITHELLERVAKTYLRALECGLPPLKEIQAVEMVAHATAAKYVRRARDAGLLGWPDRPGLAGATMPSSPFSTGRGRRGSGDQLVTTDDLAKEVDR